MTSGGRKRSRKLGAAKKKAGKAKAAPKKRAPGRPRREKAPAKTGEEICAWLAAGKTLRSYCDRPGRPSFKTVYRWMEADPAFMTRIARAREVGHDAIADECVTIIDTPLESVKVIESEKGETRIIEDNVARSRLRLEGRLKLLAKWNPRKYGERVEVEHGGRVTLEELVVASFSATAGGQKSLLGGSEDDGD